MKRVIENVIFPIFLFSMFMVGIVAAILIIVGFSIAQVIAGVTNLNKK